MTDQELRRLSRADLIDIIYTLQQQKEQAEQQLAQAQAQLQDRQLRLANAGSIAEAALSLNGVFDAAQAAADQYLQAVRTMTRILDLLPVGKCECPPAEKNE